MTCDRGPWHVVVVRDMLVVVRDVLVVVRDMLVVVRDMWTWSVTCGVDRRMARREGGRRVGQITIMGWANSSRSCARLLHLPCFRNFDCEFKSSYDAI